LEVDARDGVLLPGLIDMHVHVENDHQLRLFLKYGVTTVRDVGNSLRKIKSMRVKVNANRLIGPRIFFAGPLIDSLPEKVRKNEFFPDMNVSVNDEKQAAKVANQLMNQGADCLKVYQNMRENLIRAVVREARKRGIPVAAHSGIGSTIGEAVRAGITTVEHVHRMATELAPLVPKKSGISGPYSMMHPWASVDLQSREVKNLIKLMLQKKVYFDPTLNVVDNLGKTNDPIFTSNPDFGILDSAETSRWKVENEKFLTNVREVDFQEARDALKVAQRFVGKAFRSGVRILTGSDNGMPYSIAGESLHEEMRLLAECGIPNIDVIRASTINAASALKQANELGSVEEGKIADFVILKANPLDDIANTKEISCVVKEGKLVEFQ
jgi:imidazolonepropionase-like amidohydrolase